MTKKHPNIDLPSKKQLEKLLQQHSEHNLQGDPIDDQIKKLMFFFDAHGIQYDKFESANRDFMGLNKEPLESKAYPNEDWFINVPPKHDTKKWLMAVKNIQYKQKAGFNYQAAIRNSTHDWKKMEIYDFLNWLRFHQEGTAMKYKYAQANNSFQEMPVKLAQAKLEPIKLAQVWYENNQPGYFLHIKPDPQEKEEPVIDENAVNDAREQAERDDQKKYVIEKQRQKIIGRLDSAEKLMRSQEGQMFAGTELEGLMEAIYQLKKKVQLVNKLSVSTRLYEDMIVREANVLTRKGLTKAAQVLYSVAQTPGSSAELLDQTPEGNGSLTSQNIPTPASPPDPSGAGQTGVPAGLPSTAPGVPSVQTGVNSDQNGDQPPVKALEDNQPKGIAEFIENMNEGNKTEADDLSVSDEEEELMVSEAQAIPPTNILPAALEDVPLTDSPSPARGDVANLPPPSIPDEEPLEVKEEDIPAIKEQNKLPAGGDEAVPVDNEFDAKMDEMLANVSMETIINELEKLSKIFKTREIPRRLSLVDMMLDSKSLSSYFPQLSEAMSDALKSNNYISTRVDDVLSKLRGSIKSQDVDLVGGESNDPQMAGIRDKLKQDEDKEKQRKQNRKNQADSELDQPQKEKPQVEMGELAPPPQPISPKTPIV